MLETNRKAIATAFNDFFVSNGESLAEAFVGGEAFVFERRVPTNISYKIPKVESSYVLRELKAMSANKATGIDGITSHCLKAGAPVICDSLAFIINLSISTRLFINDWKVAKVITLNKSSNASEVSNYRLISIFSVPSKIPEQHIHTTFYDFLKSNNLITIHQSGFRPKHECDTALIKMIDDRLSNIDSGNVTGLIYIDLRKAFDTVNHRIMIQKLASYGVSEDSWNWFCSYLDSRSQYFQWQGETSVLKTITVRVPQEYILGHLLFTLYVNDFPDYVDNAVDMYADDSTLQAHDKDIKTVENKLTEMLARAAEWMRKNKLTLHLGKTKAQLIGLYGCVTKNTQITVKFNDQIIEQILSAKL